MIKKLESQEKRMIAMEKAMKDVQEKLTCLVAVNTKYVEEEFVIDVKLV